MTLKVAVVGLGGIGTRHADIYQADERCEIVAVCDAFADKADAAAQRYGCAAYRLGFSDAGRREHRHRERMHGGRRKWWRPLRTYDGSTRRGHTGPRRETNFERDTKSSGDGRSRQVEGTQIWRQPESPFHSRGCKGEGVGRCGPDGGAQHRQHDDVDQQPNESSPYFHICARCILIQST